MSAEQDAPEEKHAKQPPRRSWPTFPTWLQVVWRGQRGPFSFWSALLTLLVAPLLSGFGAVYGISALAWPMPLKLVGGLALLIALVASLAFVRMVIRTILRIGLGRLLLVLTVGFCIATAYAGITAPSGEHGLAHWVSSAQNVITDTLVSMRQSTRALQKLPDSLLFAATGQRSPERIAGVEWPGNMPPTPIVISADGVAVVAPLAPATQSELRTPGIEADAQQLNIGVSVRVVGTDGVALRARETPQTSSNITARFAPGTELIILAGPRQADGYDWWQVQGPNGVGWCVADFLALVE